MALPCLAQGSSAAVSEPAAAPSPAPARTTLARLAPTESTEAVERGEPNVTHTVIEDKGSKIEQLTVRGQVQHVVVTPKIGLTKPYEILQAPEGHNPYNGTGGAVTAAGNRVWNVLKF
jgi:hypothetical protein